jgi:hypothetical protein
MLRLPQDRTRASAFSFPASPSLPLTRKGCLLLSAGDSSRCGPHLPWLSTRPRGKHCRHWGYTYPSLFFATGSFMWLSLGAAHGGASGCWSRVATRLLWMGPLLVFTPVMWFTAKCCNDFSCEYGVLLGLGGGGEEVGVISGSWELGSGFFCYFTMGGGE